MMGTGCMARGSLSACRKTLVMIAKKRTFLVAENAIDVCEGLERRMKTFEAWESLGYCLSVKEARSKIQSCRPDLIFLDWSLNGGSAFEVLQDVQNIPGYNPYIIFNTGFQSDHPEIPQEIINQYKVDKYLVKPFWEHLRNHLPSYLREAEEKCTRQPGKSTVLWMEDDHGARIPLSTKSIACIIQNPNNQRQRDFYLSGKDTEITLPLTWNKCCELLDTAGISYFITKSREHLVVKDFIESFDNPFVRINDSSVF